MSVVNRTALMGILNYTPDSFSDGGKFNSLTAAYEHTKKMIVDGADIIDVGACSTRPGSVFATEEEERARLCEIIPFIKKEFNVPVSVDTFYIGNFRYLLDIGVEIINDVGGVYSPEKAEIIRNSSAKWVLMHGGVLSCEKEDCYPMGIVNSVQFFFDDVITKAEEDGIKDRIILDPGFGFAKNNKENAELLRSLSMTDCLGAPLLVGLSRKRFIGFYSCDDNREDRLGGTLAANILAVQAGASIIRTHEIALHRKALDFICNSEKGDLV